MKERLAEFLQLESLTAVKFAEIMEIQPSSVSHLLSGRNNPNFDFVSRLLLRFPSLNPDWIINGIGSVYKSESDRSVTNVTTGAHPSQIAMFEDVESVNLVDNQNVGEVTDGIVLDELPAIAQDRLIAKIVVLYADGSFEEYNK